MLLDCSGVLIGQDLIVTAGQCLGLSREEAEANCEERLVLFDFALTEDGVLPSVTTDSVRECRRVVLFEHPDEGSDSDVAIVQLSEAAPAGHVPAKVVTLDKAATDEVFWAGHPLGLPLKVDPDVQVGEPLSGSAFVASADSFFGGSGSGLFDEQGSLFGIQRGGAPDFVFDADRECSFSLRLPDEEEGEVFQRLDRVILCAEGSSSEGVCTSTHSEPRDPNSKKGLGTCAWSRPPREGTMSWSWTVLALLVVGRRWTAARRVRHS